jgi:hypothetical protein
MTTTSTAFFDQQLQQQQAYFRNQYPIANNTNPSFQSPIIVPPPQQQPIFPFINATAAANHSFPHANHLEQVCQMIITLHNNW